MTLQDVELDVAALECGEVWFEDGWQFAWRDRADAPRECVKDSVLAIAPLARCGNQVRVYCCRSDCRDVGGVADLPGDELGCKAAGGSSESAR